MIGHNNQLMGMQPTNQLGSGKLTIGIVNNREEGLMFNVPTGYTAYIFNRFAPEFYVKDNNNMTGQCTFSDYTYNEKVMQQPQMAQQPQAQVQQPTNYLTKDDVASIKNDIVNSVLAAIQQKGDDGIRG